MSAELRVHGLLLLLLFTQSIGLALPALHRPLNVTEGGRTTTYGYDLAGRAISQQSGNGQFSENQYDALGRLTHRLLYASDARTTVLASFSWQHDALGNVTQQTESWPGSSSRPAGTRTTDLSNDADGRLTLEKITEADGTFKETAYTYDAANNRATKLEKTGGVLLATTTYTYNSANQLIRWSKSASGQALARAAFSYDGSGNRVASLLNYQSVLLKLDCYAWDGENRLVSVARKAGVMTPAITSMVSMALLNIIPVPQSIPGVGLTGTHSYGYDYRTRRVSVTEPSGSRAVVFSGGLSTAEYAIGSPSESISSASSSAVTYQRGPDMGGGVGGLLYSLRASTAKFNLSNGRGDIVAQSDSTGALTWTASYEAYGKRPVETGSNADRQRANSKEEDPTGLLNEGFRYRDIETGVWLSRDPAGFVDGPNLYAYVRQNPWTAFDPEGLFYVSPFRSLSIAFSEACSNAVAEIKSWFNFDTHRVEALKNDPIGFGRGTVEGQLGRPLGKPTQGSEAGRTFSENLTDAVAVLSLAKGAAGGMRGGTSPGLVTTNGQIVQETTTAPNLPADVLLNQNTGDVQPTDSAKSTSEKTKPTPRKPSAQIRKEWETENGATWPKDEALGRNQDVAHKKALADGGSNELDNIKPLPHAEHMEEHKAAGDFKRWGAKSKKDTEL